MEKRTVNRVEKAVEFRGYSLGIIADIFGVRHIFEKIKQFEYQEPKIDAISLNSDSNNNSNY